MRAKPVVTSGSETDLSSHLFRIAVLLPAAAAPVLGVVAPLGMAPLVGLAGALALLGWTLKRRLPVVDDLTVLLLGLVCVLGLASYLWTIAPDQSLPRALRLCVEVALGLSLLGTAARLSDRTAALLGRVLAVSITVAVLILLFEKLSGGGLTELLKPRRVGLSVYDRGVVILALLVWPAALLLSAEGRKRSAAALFLAVVATAAIFDSDAAKLALAIGVLAALFLAVVPSARVARATKWVLPVILIVIALGAQFLPTPQSLASLEGIKPSGVHRLVIWRFVADRIAERPLLGWGLESSRQLPGGQETVLYQGPGDSRAELSFLPLHPHNAALQIWVELGIPGLLLMAALLYHLGGTVVRADLLERAATAGMLSAALIIALLSYGIWQSWWDETLFLLAAFGRSALRGRAR